MCLNSREKNYHLCLAVGKPQGYIITILCNCEVVSNNVLLLKCCFMQFDKMRPAFLFFVLVLCFMILLAFRYKKLWSCAWFSYTFRQYMKWSWRKLCTRDFPRCDTKSFYSLNIDWARRKGECNRKVSAVYKPMNQSQLWASGVVGKMHAVLLYNQFMK